MLDKIKLWLYNNIYIVDLVMWFTIVLTGLYFIYRTI